VIEKAGELHGADYDSATEKHVDPLGDKYEDFPADQAEDIIAAEGFKIAGEVKELGNKAYKASDWPLALEKYQKAVRYINESEDPTPEDPETLAKDIAALKFSLFNNSAQVHIKQKDYASAVRSATSALEVPGQPAETQAKALYRRAEARSERKQDEEAMEDLEKALSLAPGDAAVKRKLEAIKVKVAAYKKKQQAAYSKFFE
jgi:peptidyl-prolyl isomerase D